MGFVGLEAEEYDRLYKDRTLLKRIFKYFRPYRHSMLQVIILLSTSSLAYAFTPVIISFLITLLQTNQEIAYLFTLIILILALNVSSWGINYFRQKRSSRIIADVVQDLREDATNSVLQHDLSFFDKYPIGKIVSRVNSDSRDFGQSVELTMEVISSVLVMVILLVIMFNVNLFLTFIFVLSMPIFVTIALSFRKLARAKTLLGQRALALVNAFVKESFSGIQIAKTFRQEEKLYNQFLDINNTSYRVNMVRAFVLNSIFPSLGILQGIVTTLLVYYGGLGITTSQITAGEFNLFFQGLVYLFFPLLTIASFWPQFQAGLSASERIFSLIDTAPVVIQTNNIKTEKFEGRLRIKNLVFQYEKDKKVFDNFSLSIDPGESVAIVGHTGAGKSSLASLIARFYEFQGGEILVDGISIREFDLKEYRKQIGIIPQTPFLWADTIENNIKYCCSTATTEMVISALEKTSGKEWINGLAKGLNTDVGERGNLLSMGQRQLVVFARVLLEDPSILILDEATASVDPFTETQIQDALQHTIKGRTSIIIAHRLWTVRHVDRIIVIDHGRIVEEGNHDKLMAKGGKYAELYNTYFRHQSLKYIEDIQEICEEK